MFNLVKSYIYRLARGKMAWALLVGAMDIPVASAAAVWLPTSSLGAAIVTDGAVSLSFPNQTSLLHQFDPLPAIVLCIFAAAFTAQDAESRFDVTLDAPCRRKRALARSIVLAAYCTLWYGALIASTELSFRAFGFTIGVQPMDTAWGNIALSTLGLIVYALLVALATDASRSKAVGSVFGFLLGSGCIDMACGTLLNAASIAAPALGALLRTALLCLPGTVEVVLMDGNGSSKVLARALEGAGGTMELPSELDALLILCVWVIGAASVWHMMERRRDVA